MEYSDGSTGNKYVGLPLPGTKTCVLIQFII